MPGGAPLFVGFIIRWLRIEHELKTTLDVCAVHTVGVKPTSLFPVLIKSQVHNRSAMCANNHFLLQGYVLTLANNFKACRSLKMGLRQVTEFLL